MGFNLEDREEWVNDYRKIWKAVEDQLFVTFMSEPVKEGATSMASESVERQDKDRFSWERHPLQPVL